MVTTFERLAKVLKGYIKPANWIERAFASIGSAVLPSVSSSDNGKILGVSSGAWAVTDAPDGLPSVSASDNGKFLGVSNGAWGVTDAPDGLPSVTSADEGKVLTVNSSGEWDAEEVSGTHVVTFSTEDFETWTCDKTYSQISAWINAKEPIVAFSVFDGSVNNQSTIVRFGDNATIGPHIAFDFSKIEVMSGALSAEMAYNYIKSDNTVGLSYGVYNSNDG